MNNRQQQLDDFFNHYCSVFNQAISGNDLQINQTKDFFSNCFIGADPSGVRCGNNDEAFIVAMKEGFAFYRAIGITSMEIVSKTFTLLDDVHSMTRISWQSNFIKEDGQRGSIEFENIYFTQYRDEQHKIFAYITGDEHAALSSAGLT